MWMDSEPWHVIFAIALWMATQPIEKDEPFVMRLMISTYPKHHKLGIFLQFFLFFGEGKNVPFLIDTSMRSPLAI